jgi:hypothetical protein
MANVSFSQRPQKIKLKRKEYVIKNLILAIFALTFSCLA